MMKWIFLLLALLVPGLAFGQSYNAQSYTAGSFYKGCGGTQAGHVCSADLLMMPVQVNGTMTYCQDCLPNATCDPGGTGALALMADGKWTCSMGVGTACESGSFNNIGCNNISCGPGNTNIIGSSSSVITNIPNINGQMFANYFPGSDLGAKVNNAITALGPQGGIVNIGPGNYNFSTTIQCPLASSTIIIQGSGESWTGTSGTLLNYTGTGDAINDFNTNSAANNDVGCKVRDLTLSGPGATTTAVGFHFGGTSYTETRDIMIAKFGSGIKVENASGLWTERYVIEQTGLFLNGTGIYFHCDSGCNTSFGHAKIDADINITDNQYGLRVDGGGWIYATRIAMNGNANPSTANSTLISTTGINDMIAGGLMESNMECNASGSGACIRFSLAAGSSVGGTLVDYNGGPWGDTGTGAEAFRQTAAYTNITVPNGGHTAIQGDPGLGGINPYCGGMFTVSTLNTGDTAAYLCGATFCGLVLESWPGGVWVQSTPTPAAGKASIAWSPSDNGNAIYNNTGATQSYTIATLCSKHAG